MINYTFKCETSAEAFNYVVGTKRGKSWANKTLREYLDETGDKDATITLIKEEKCNWSKL